MFVGERRERTSGNVGNARVRFPEEKARVPRAYIAPRDDDDDDVEN